VPRIEKRGTTSLSGVEQIGKIETKQAQKVGKTGEVLFLKEKSELIKLLRYYPYCLLTLLTGVKRTLRQESGFTMAVFAATKGGKARSLP
jgi:hypothetical protein